MTQLQAMALTLLVECGVLLLLIWRHPPKPPWTQRDWVTIGCAASMITHPIMWWCWFAFPQGSYAMRFVVFELLVTLAEGALYKVVFDVRWRTALGLSALLNGCSSGLGLLLYFH